MDISSMLSPQETTQTPPISQAKTPGKKPRKPRGSQVTQPSPLAQATLPPPTLPHNAVVQSKHTSGSPLSMSPTLGYHTGFGSAVSTPPTDARTSRQPSTPGMDTLADLASMQHHQQTTRANAGGLRTTELYDSPISSAAILPTPYATAISQTPSQLRESNLRRGASYDMPMIDGSAETPSQRAYPTSAFSTAELGMVNQLSTHLATSPFAYDSHIQFIHLLRQGLLNLVRQNLLPMESNDAHDHPLLRDLQSARGNMNARFALGEDMWMDWIQDQILLAQTIFDRMTVLELCQKAVEDEPSSSKLWEVYGQFMLFLYKNANPQDARTFDIGSMPMGQGWSDEDRIVASESFPWHLLIDIWERGAKETRSRMNDSHVLWDTYMELMLRDFASTSPQGADHQEQKSFIASNFLARLQTPHVNWDNTLQAYSTFVSRYDNSNYEETMVEASRVGADAKSKSSAREVLEVKLLRASQNDKVDERQVYDEYLEWELSQNKKRKLFDFELTSALYQRATLRFPADTALWENYAMFMIDETSHAHSDVSAFPVLDKATRHCPWSGDLWSQYLLAAENKGKPFKQVEEIKHKATSSGLLDAGGLEEILKIQTAWCGFLRRRAFLPDSTEEDADVAEMGIRSAIENMETLGKEKYGKEYQGDPRYRLQKIYNKHLSQAGDFDRAREVYKQLIPRKGDSYDFWIRYYLWEMATWCKLSYNKKGVDSKIHLKPTEATKVLQRAMNRPKLDWPEKIIETFQYHCEDHEDAEALQSAIAQVWKAKKAVQKRREKEAYEAYEMAQAQAYQQQEVAHDVAPVGADAENGAKRKREDDEETGMHKKVRPAASIEVDPQAEEAQLSIPSQMKRDRENASIVVRNLPAGTTEIKVRQLFRDCGTINSLKVVNNAEDESATAWIEFDSKEDVPTAQTKDLSTFEGRAIEVQVDSGSKLYVCNFPPTADEAWIRDKFRRYGEIVDIRFPSLKYNTHRRFCYIQFGSSTDAQAATELDGEDVGGELSLVAKISDPSHKQDRHGAIYDGRELFLANLDWGASQTEIRKAFARYGKVEKVRIPKKVDGKSKGIGYVVFSNKEEASAALEMNLTQFKNRILNVSISTNDKSKREANRIITSTSHQSTASPTPGLANHNANGDRRNAGPPTTTNVGQSKYAEIQSRTIYLLNIPDTVNEARVRALAEPYGDLVKLSLQPNHQGARLEYKDVASAGKASLGLEGQEIVPGRRIAVGTEDDMKQQKSEYRSDKIVTGAARREAAKLQGPAPVRRPNQPGARRGGKAGLGFKRGGVSSSGERTTTDGEEHGAEVHGGKDKPAPEVKPKAKSNAEFKAMFLKKYGE